MDWMNEWMYAFTPGQAIEIRIPYGTSRMGTWASEKKIHSNTMVNFSPTIIVQAHTHICISRRGR